MCVCAFMYVRIRSYLMIYSIDFDQRGIIFLDFGLHS